MSARAGERTRRRLWIIVAGIIGCVMIAGGIAVQQYFKPHKNYGSATPDEVLAARDLIAAFERDEAAATARYVTGNVTVEVWGTVRDVQSDGGTTTVTIGSDDDAGSVACTLDAETDRRAVRVGEEVAVRGQCAGMQALIDTQVIMIRCAVRGRP